MTGLILAVTGVYCPIHVGIQRRGNGTYELEVETLVTCDWWWPGIGQGLHGGTTERGILMRNGFGPVRHIRTNQL